MAFFVLSILCIGLVFAEIAAEHHNEHYRHNIKEKSHEHHNSHYSGRHHGHHSVRHQHQGSHFLHHGYRANDNNKQCSWVCTDASNNTSPSSDIQAVYNGSASLFSIESKSSNIALAIDYSCKTIIFIQGKSRVHIVDLTSQQITCVYQSPQTKEFLYNPSKGTFEDYLQNLSVPNLIKIGQQYGDKTQLSSIPEPLNKEIEDDLKLLGIPLSSKEALQILTTFSSYLKNFLSALYKGNGSFDLPAKFHWFLKLNIVLANLLNPENTGIDLSKINLDPKSIFQGTSGIEALVKILTEIGKKADLSKLGNLFSSREKALKILTDISAGSHNGLDGLITILVNIVKALSGEGSIGEVISSVLKYNGTSIDEPTYAQLLNQAIEICRSQHSIFNNGDSLAPVYKFLHALVNNNLFLTEVNICDIIKIFFSPNPLDRIATVIKILSCFAPHRGIPQFFKFITELINSTDGQGILSGLVPGLNISQIAGNGNILQNILQGRNLTDLFSNGGNVSSVLSQIPILGPIASQISLVLQHGGENLEKHLHPGHVKDIFTGGLSNLTSGAGFGHIFGQILNSTQGAGIASGIQNGIKQIFNSTQGESIEGGLASSIQNGIGGLFGIGGHGQDAPSTTLASASETSSPSSVDSNSSITSNSTVAPVSSGGIESYTISGLPKINETLPNSSSNQSEPGNSTNENQTTGGGSSQFSSRGWTGVASGGFNIHNRHKGEHNHRQNRKSENKHHS